MCQLELVWIIINILRLMYYFVTILLMIKINWLISCHEDHWKDGCVEDSNKRIIEEIKHRQS